ncbi:MAG: hypothetical protein R2762_25180 [Bryobacteraceae bacterium]
MSKRYSFSASAVGFSAHVRRPDDVLIKSQAASAIGSTGGLSSTRASDSRFFKGSVCFGKAVSSCEGEYRPAKDAAKFTDGNHGDNDLPAVTRVTSAVSGVAIINAKDTKAPKRKLTIKKACFDLEIFDPRTGGRQSEFTLDPKKLILDKVSIDGCLLRITFATDLFNEFKTQDALKAAWEGDQEFAAKYGHLFEPIGECHTREFPATRYGGTLATVVHKVEWANPKKTAPDVTFEGANRVRIEGIGTLVLGELLITPKRRRLSMFRVELGSAYGGDAEGATARVAASIPDSSNTRKTDSLRPWIASFCHV